MLLRGASSRLRQIRCEHFSRSSSSIPPSITTWIDRLTAQPPSVATDIIDAQRASHLQRTLPTRIGPNALGLPIVGAGQPLPAGHHLVYFQPQTTLDALGADGSSTVRPVCSALPSPPCIIYHKIWHSNRSVKDRSSTDRPTGIQRTSSIPPTHVGRRFVRVESDQSSPYRIIRTRID